MYLLIKGWGGIIKWCRDLFQVDYVSTVSREVIDMTKVETSLDK